MVEVINLDTNLGCCFELCFIMTNMGNLNVKLGYLFIYFHNDTNI
jgi:hypothetical protein